MSPVKAEQQPVTTISAADIGRLAKDRAPASMVFLDASLQDIQQRVRLTNSYQSGNLDANKHPYPLSTSIVFYDFSFGGKGVTEAARVWTDAGYKFIYILRGGCAGAAEAKVPVDTREAPTDVLPYSVTAQSLMDALKQKEELVIVDFRSDIEFSADHISGAINLKPSELLSKIAASDKTKWIVLYDSFGNSLDPLIWQLRRAGYLQAGSLAGGY